MDVYDEENEVNILHVDVELQSLFGACSNALLPNLKAPLGGDQPPLAPSRKDRLLFTGAPPEAASGAVAADFGKRLLLLNNIHWALTDVDIIDGSCTYGAVAGVYIFEDPRRFHKSEGIALIEFRTLTGAEAALKDEGKCWTSKQGDRKVTVLTLPSEAVSLLEELAQKYGCWTKAPQLPSGLVDVVYAKVGKAVPNAASAPLPAPTLATAAPRICPTKLPVPLAVQMLIEKCES